MIRITAGMKFNRTLFRQRESASSFRVQVMRMIWISMLQEKHMAYKS